jgi:hypothetical protein
MPKPSKFEGGSIYKGTDLEDAFNSLCERSKGTKYHPEDNAWEHFWRYLCEGRGDEVGLLARAFKLVRQSIFWTIFAIVAVGLTAYALIGGVFSKALFGSGP